MYVEFQELPDRLRIGLTPRGREEIAEMRYTGRPAGSDRQLWELIEYQLCNGWTVVPPEDIGALTDATILTQDASFGDDGRVVLEPDATVYWFPNYQILDPVAELYNKGFVDFPKGE